MAKKHERVQTVANHNLRLLMSLLSPVFGYVRNIVTIFTMTVGAMFLATAGIGRLATSQGASEVYLRASITAGMLQIITKWALVTTISTWILWFLFWYVCVGNRTLSQWVGYHTLDKKGKELYRTPEYSWDGHELAKGEDGKLKKLPAPEGGIPQIQHSIQEVGYIGNPIKYAIEAVKVLELGEGRHEGEEAEDKGERAESTEEKAGDTEGKGTDTEGKGE